MTIFQNTIYNTNNNKIINKHIDKTHNKQFCHFILYIFENNNFVSLLITLSLSSHLGVLGFWGNLWASQIIMRFR